MSVFGSIMSKIFSAAETAVGVSPSSMPAGASPPPASPAPTTAPAGQPQTPVDVEAVLTQMASQKGGGGNWGTSIVDLLKLLDLDSSLNARKELAQELNVHVGASRVSSVSSFASQAATVSVAAHSNHFSSSFSLLCFSARVRRMKDFSANN
jgi:Domain of unknown function (DUF3597)